MAESEQTERSRGAAEGKCIPWQPAYHLLVDLVDILVLRCEDGALRVRQLLLRKRMKERTRARMRAGATRTRNPSFGSGSGEKELRNPSRNVNCSIAERANFPTQSLRRTTNPIPAASTTPNLPTAS